MPALLCGCAGAAYSVQAPSRWCHPLRAACCGSNPDCKYQVKVTNCLSVTHSEPWGSVWRVGGRLGGLGVRHGPSAFSVVVGGCRVSAFLTHSRTLEGLVEQQAARGVVALRALNGGSW
jgi:hypothetical protein